MNFLNSNKIAIFIYALFFTLSSSQTITTVDLLNHYTYEDVLLWNNIYGVTLKLEDYINNLGD